QWGIRRTWKSVVPLKQQAITRRVTIAYPTENAPLAERKATLVHQHKARSGARGRKCIACTFS
ncbi:MAG: hypothetical protein ACOVLE_06140, partial [Pirellula staleyi]